MGRVIYISLEKKYKYIYCSKTSENAISPTEKVVNEYKKYRKRATQCVPNVVHTCKMHSGLLGCTERICKRDFPTGSPPPVEIFASFVFTYKMNTTQTKLNFVGLWYTAQEVLLTS